MITLGLNAIEPWAREPLVNTRLLASKFSLATYIRRYILKVEGARPSRPSRAASSRAACRGDVLVERHALFPALDAAHIQHISNTLPGLARVCAADDLDLSLAGGHDQIEFFDNYFLSSPDPPRQRYHEAPPPELAAYSYDMPVFHDFSPPSSMASSHPHLLVSLLFFGPLDGYDMPPKPTQYLQIQLQPVQQFDDAPVAVAPYFNDFKHQPVDASSLYGLLSELYVSPLDEMFFKKPTVRQSFAESEESVFSQEPRKRRASPEPFFREVIYKNFKEEASEGPCESRKKLKVEEGSQERFKFACHHCEASFKVKAYLTRHLRKHNNAKAFVCPFYEDGELDHAGSVVKRGTKCHPTGGFSRRDTYKTHLKALHFIYPPGTKSSERQLIGGRCAGCFEFFDNNASWLKAHIEGGECRGIMLPVMVKRESVD